MPYDAARDELSAGRLLIPAALADQCDAFFKRLFEGQVELAFATHPMIWDAMQRAGYWDKAKAIAYEQIPQLRREIEKTARGVIHEPWLSIVENDFRSSVSSCFL